MEFILSKRYRYENRNSDGVLDWFVYQVLEIKERTVLVSVLDDIRTENIGKTQTYNKNLSENSVELNSNLI